MSDRHAAIRRVQAAIDGGDALAALATEVGGADLSSFLLEVMQRRAAGRAPADVVRQARTDRHVEPAALDGRVLHTVIAQLLTAIPNAFEIVELAPVAPLGTSSTVATVHQHKIVSTVRGTEVAADPTNALALLAAIQRAVGRGGPIRLGAVQRILRAQPFGAIGQQHFSVLGLVTAGRDLGSLRFERSALIEHLDAIVHAVRTVTSDEILVRVTSLRDGFTDALIGDAQAAVAGATVTADPHRAAGRGYYRDLCFKVVVGTAAGEVEVGDGGFTDWMQRLTGNRKERLLTSGIGVDRLVRLRVN